MDILINHIGYEPDLPKKAILQSSHPDVPGTFALMDEKLDCVLTSEITPLKQVHHWKDRFFSVFDFSEVTKEGTYVISVKTGEKMITSEPFSIKAQLLKYETLFLISDYFFKERCCGLYDDADSAVPFFGKNRKDRVDLHGGWYDASGDVSKYLSHLSYANFMNPQQTPLVVWNLMDAAARVKTQFPEIALKLEEEALYGADFLTRMQDPSGYFYMTVFDKWSKDPGQREICSYKTQMGDKYESWQAGFRQGGGMTIAALAKASFLKNKDNVSSGIYLEKARLGYEHLAAHNRDYLDDKRENIIDDYCALMASVSLFKATHEDRFYKDSKDRSASLLARISNDDRYDGWWRADDSGERPYFHAAEAGFPYIALLTFLELEENSEDRESILRQLKRAMAHEMTITDEVYNPFGYARQYVKPLGGEKQPAFFIPHQNESGYWWQGENARIASLATAALRMLPWVQTDAAFCEKLKRYHQNQMDWILGLNPFDICMLGGKGRNNPDYPEGRHNTDGGVCNGITSGFEDENDIDFSPPGRASELDQNWRWREQWLPHGAWFLTAIV